MMQRRAAENGINYLNVAREPTPAQLREAQLRAVEHCLRHLNAPPGVAREPTAAQLGSAAEQCAAGADAED